MRKLNVDNKSADKWGHMQQSRTLVWSVTFCYRWAAAILKTGAIIRRWKTASCVLLSLIYPLYMPNSPPQFPSNTALISTICFVFIIKWNTFRQHFSDSLSTWCYIASVMKRLQSREAEDIWIIYISCHRLMWFLCSKSSIILLLFVWGGLRHFLRDTPSLWFVPGEKQHINLMCPGLTWYTSSEKDACSHLCNHSGRSRGHMSPVSHFRANLSFHSPSLHIKQHKWLNLHDRICNMANQVSASIKHYTSTLS